MTFANTLSTPMTSPLPLGSTDDVVVRMFLPEVGFVRPEEIWLWQNPEAVRMALRGLEEAARGETHYLGSFAQYLDLDIDD